MVDCMSLLIWIRTWSTSRLCVADVEFSVREFLFIHFTSGRPVKKQFVSGS